MPDIFSLIRKRKRSKPSRRRGWRKPAVILLLCLALAVWAMPPKLPPTGSVPNSFTASREHYQRADFEDKLPELHARFGKNKVIPPEYELEILLALSHYPRLKDAHIHFVLNEDPVPITSRPYIWPMFRRKKNWVYLVTISKGSAYGSSPVYLKNMSFDSRIGGIGHELGHTAFYIQKSLPQMAGVGFCFLFRKYQIHFERSTDERAIDHGLGWQLFSWAAEIRGGRTQTSADSWLDIYYLSPEQIEGEMRQKPEYAPYFEEKKP